MIFTDEADVLAAKDNLRQIMQTRRKSFPRDVRMVKSRLIIDRLQREECFAEAKFIMLYASLPYEVQLFSLIKKCRLLKKCLALPIILDNGNMKAAKFGSVDELVPDAYGILSANRDNFEPLPADMLDLIIVPGVAFSAKGDRLGIGGGFYDRFLPQAKKARRVALAFDFQIVDNVPTLPHDEKVETLITETRTIYASDSANPFSTEKNDDDEGFLPPSSNKKSVL